jgi:hypothetical protein
MWRQPPPAVQPRSGASSVTISSCRLWLLLRHAQQDPLLVECYPGTPTDSLAKPISSLAHRDLYRCKDEADRFSGVLGIHVARTPRTLALPAVDGRDGTLGTSETEEFLTRNLCSTRNPRNQLDRTCKCFWDFCSESSPVWDVCSWRFSWAQCLKPVRGSIRPLMRLRSFV